MNEQLKRDDYREDEFDVEVIASKLWRIQKKFWKKLFYPLHILLLKPKRLALILVLSVTISLILRYTIPPVYESTFVIKPINAGDTYYMGMLHDLNTMISDKNYPLVSEKLKLEEPLVEKLKKVEANPIFKSPFRKDTIVAVEITLLMAEANLIDTFQEAIYINYLSRSPYYLKSKLIRDEELSAMEARMISDLRENDSLKKVLTSNAFPRGGGGFVFGEPIDPLEVYEAGLNLYQKLITIHSQRQYSESFELAKPGMIRLKPYFPRMIIIGPVLVGLGLIVCLIMNLREQRGV